MIDITVDNYCHRIWHYYGQQWEIMDENGDYKKRSFAQLCRFTPKAFRVNSLVPG